MTKRWMLTLCVGAIACVGPGVADATRGDKAADMRAAITLARDGDLQADWSKMLDARDRFVALAADTEIAALAHYYIGYTYWRLSSLAYVAVGQQAQVQLAERAVKSLETAVQLRPDFPDAQALLSTCLATLLKPDRSNVDTLLPRIRGAAQAALPAGERNPRVMLLRAMGLIFAPPEYGGNRDKGFELWKQAIAGFEKERPAPLMPDWGHAEALAWLGGVYLRFDQPQDAVPLLERAVALRPDFWWASKAALPVARRPLK
jgi:tetratricopeptide (TPR) repeat protein